MNRRTVFSKTGKGLMEATGKSSNLSLDLRDILKEVDGNASVSALLKKFENMSGRELAQALRNLEREGYVRELIAQEDAGSPAATGRPSAPRASGGAGGDGDLDFTDFTPAKPSADTSEDARLRAQAIRVREEAEATAKAEAERRAGPSAQAKAKAEGQARAQ